MSLVKGGDLDDVERIRLAINKLRSARDLVASAKAPRAADRVRRALNSTEGALRHAQNRKDRTPS